MSAHSVSHNTIFRLQALKVIETFTDIGNVHEARIAASLFMRLELGGLEVQLRLAIPTSNDHHYIMTNIHGI